MTQGFLPEAPSPLCEAFQCNKHVSQDARLHEKSNSHLHLHESLLKRKFIFGDVSFTTLWQGEIAIKRMQSSKTGN